MTTAVIEDIIIKTFVFIVIIICVSASNHYPDSRIEKNMEEW